uniref:Arrestin C-terminal-like domain-containing protein n=1 Tax=Globisporangium ultimum (strain ATCC 200006 / CBS 805.95 / DAOM BR144) TaxID=431595 RepID=K3WPC0_GLOUD
MDTSSTTSGPQFVGEIGVKGELYISVDKSEYYAGDTISGRLNVLVSETIHCDTLVFTITGEESAQWSSRGDHHSRYQEFLKHEILVNVLPNPYLPGEYLYPFSYTLPADIPGVLDADSLDGDLQALHATIKYTLKASIKVEGRFVSDLESTHALVVRERHRGTAETSQGVERTVSKRVRMLGCINRGTCHVAASMKKNVLALGETARVDIFVNNHTSSASIKHVSCRVYQDVTIPDPKGSGMRKVCSRPLLQVRATGPKSGELLERPMDFVLAGKLRFPSTEGSFVKCSYRITLECELFLAKTIKIDIPVTILPAQGPLQPLPVAHELLLLHPSARSATPLPPAVPSSAASSTSTSSAHSRASAAPYAHLAVPRTPATIDLMA